MSDENTRMIHQLLISSQDKYVYFLLAATLAAIGFTITQTQTLKLGWTQVPVGISVFFWGLSFICGCVNRMYYNSALYANLHYLRVLRGKDPTVGTHPQLIQAASEGITKAMNYNSDKANKHGHYQMVAFILGAAAYITWHVLEMYLRCKIPTG